MKINLSFKDILPLTAVLALTIGGCGSNQQLGQNKNHNLTKSTTNILEIDNSNYIDLAKYYYSREISLLNIKKSSLLRKGSKSKQNRINKIINPNVIKVKCVTPFDKYIQKLTITQQDKKIIAKIDKDNKIVNITYSDSDDKNRNIKDITIPLSEFTNLEKRI